MVIWEKETSEFPDARKEEPDNTWGMKNVFIKRDYQKMFCFTLQRILTFTA